MFRKIDITNGNRNRKADKLPPIPVNNLFKEWSFEANPMRYASWVHEQVASHRGYQSLDIDAQGQFWRLITEIAKPGRYGRFDNPLRILVKTLQIPQDRAERLLEQLLQAGLIRRSDDEIDYIQPELREQCLLYCVGDKPMENHPELWKEDDPPLQYYEESSLPLEAKQ